MKYLCLLITALLSCRAVLSHSNEDTQFTTSKHDEISNALSRQLRIGDFDEFNELFENASIVLPGPFSAEQRVAFVNLKINIYNVRCYGVNVGDMSISHQTKSSQDIEVLINVLQLDLDCEMDYDYQWGAANGDGWLKVQTDDSSASTSINFVSDDFNTKPPKSSSVSGCEPDIRITRLDFEEDFLSEVLEAFQFLVRGAISNAVGEVACEELGSLGTTLVENVMTLASDALEPYQGELTEAESNPLHAEQNLNLPATLKALDFQDSESSISQLMRQAFDSVESLLETVVPNEDSNQDDLLFNLFLRSFILEEDGSYTIPASEMPIDSVLFEGHDRITQTTMTLNEVKVFGLDSLTVFDPFNAIGKYTLDNKFNWRQIKIEFDITIFIRPSTLDDAILKDPTSPGITERITVDFGLDNVEVVASLLMLLDEEGIDGLNLGPLLYTEYALPCILSVVHQTRLTGLTFNPQTFNEPTLNGFISPGIDRVVSDSVEAAFAMYAGSLRATLPYIFQTTVRTFVNTNVIDTYMADSSKTVCPTVEQVPGYVDFRKFFDNEDSSHGDLPPLLKNLFNAELLSLDDNGKPKINDILIKPFTEAQSGVAGNLEFSTDLFGINSETVPHIGMDSLELRAFNPSVRNLDSMGAPIDLLKTNDENGYLLENFATVGANPDSIEFALKGLLALSGDETLAMYNEIELSVNIGNADFFAGLIAMVDSQALQSFPLKDIANLNCWLAMLATPQIDSNGQLKGNTDIGLMLESLRLTADSMAFDVSCTNCTSSSLSVLPEVFQTLESTGVSNILEKRLIDMGLEVASSEYVQAYINELLINGALRCPNSPNYVDTSATSNYQVPTFPALAHESLETVAFASSLLLHMATVVIAEAHSSYDLEDTNPMDGQNELEEQPNLKLIDFTSFESSVGGWANDAVRDVLEYISETIDDSSSPTGKDIRINSILRSNFLDESGALDIEFNDIGIGSDDVQISLRHVRVLGLDTVSSLNMLDAIGAQTLQNVWKWQKLGVEVEFSLLSSGTDISPAGRALKSIEDITLSLEFGDIDVSLALLLALDIDRLGELKLESFLDIANILPCILTAAHSAKFSEFQVLAGSIKKFGITGFKSEELNTAAAESSRIILEKYGQKIVSSVPGVFDMTVRALINNMMGYYMGDGSSIVCPTPSAKSALTGFVDFRDLLLAAGTARQFGGSGLSQYGNLFSTALGIVQDLIFKVDDSTGLSAINDLVVAPFTETQSNKTGSMVFEDLFDADSRVIVGGLDAKIQLRASDVRIDNLDTIGSPIELLQAIMDMPHQLNNTMTFGTEGRPVRMALTFLLSLMGDDDMQVRNEVEISLDLHSASVMLQAMMKVAESRFYGFPMRDIFDLNCWLAMIPAPKLDQYGVRSTSEEPTVSLEELAATAASLSLNVTCIDCSSPRMPELTELLSKAEAQEDLSEAMNALLDYVTDMVGGNFLQVQIDRILNDAGRKCPHSPSYEPEFEAATYKAFQAPDSEPSMSLLVTIAALAIVALLVVAALIYFIKWIVRRRHKHWLGTLPAHQVQRLAQEQHREEREETELNSATKSMFSSPVVPMLVRFGMPFIIIGNIFLFLSGHLSLGATVNIEAELAGEKISIDKFFEFSMARSTMDIWNAGGEELAIIILIFSGIWPYTKQLMTLAVWFLPTARLSVSRRESILIWLDRLGKWSMIDVFVLVVSIAAFRVSVISPSLRFLPEDFYSIDMLVVPLWGLYANMLAQLTSQVSSHFVIYYHRRIISEAKAQRGIYHGVARSPSAAMEGPQKGANNSRVSVEVSSGANEPVYEMGNARVSLCQHQYSRPHRGETEKLIVRPWVNKLLLLGSLSLIVLVIVGCSMPSFSLEFLGIIGVAVETGQNFEDATTQHSVFTVIQLLFEEAEFLGTAGDYLGLGTLSVLFVLTVLLVPVIQALALLRQWFRPSTHEEMQKMSVFIEILQAWQYADVYLIAIFVTSWQIGPISEFMINAYCESLEETFGQLVYYGLLKEEDAQCFSVRASINGGSFFLALGVILLVLLGSFVSKAVVQYMRDQRDTEKRLRDEEDSLLGSVTDDDGEGVGGISARIHPVPVLFTDTFRWLLYQENNRWGLPDTHYHWGAVASNPNRAMFLPEAQVLIDESSSAPSQFPKMKYADAKIEQDASNTKKAPPSSSASASSSFRGFKAKGIPVAGLKTTGLPPRESFEQLAASDDNYNDETNSFTSEPMFRDEASTTGMSLPPSTPDAAPSRATATTAEYHNTMTTAESEFDYETVVTNDDVSEYEEQTVMSEYDRTVMSEYEEQTVNTGYMTEIQEELEDVISNYDQTSGVRPLD
ncbi:unnamed protein product [Cylindrotheca closterium]|uniref:Calmodulin n=1 Tax=Cylindrotheca closterium TaxID=2856 RepID=A0AAD2CYP9_9STRA|nr:unnamed protein product [Cylindrotheca closterium]